jgi:hypothetical protein
MAFLKQKDSLESQNLSLILRRKFSIKLAIDIKQHLQIEPIAPNKIGVSFTKDLQLSQINKETFTECLRYVYGVSIAIVERPKSNGTKIVEKTVVPFNAAAIITQGKAKVQETAIEDKYKDLTQWQIVQEHLISTYGEDIVRVSFAKLSISESANQITFIGSDTFTEIAEGKFGASLSWLAKEYGLCFIFKGKSEALEEFIIKLIS